MKLIDISKVFSVRRPFVFGVILISVSSAACGINSESDALKVFRNLRELTLSRSPEVKLAISNFEQRTSAHHTAWTRWAPRVDLRLSDTVNKDYSLLTSGSFGSLGNAFAFTPTQVELKAYELVMQVPIFNRSVELGILRSNADLELAKTQMKLAKDRVSWSLRQVFGEYLLQMYRLSTIDRSMKLAASNLQEAQVRFRLGSRTVIDILKAQAQEAQLQARKVTYESDRSQAMSRLMETAGLTADDLIKAGLPSVTSEELKLAASIESFADAKSSAAEIRKYPTDHERLARTLESLVQTESSSFSEILLRSRLENLQAKSIVASEWPELFLRGTLGKQTGQWSDTFSSNLTSYSYGLVLNIPLFSFGSSFSLGREASGLIVSSEIRRQQSTQSLVNNVLNLILRGQALVKTTESLKFGVDKNNEIERLTLRSYQLGKETFLDLQIAQNDVVESKIQLAQAQIEMAVLIWQIKWNLGSVNEEVL